MKVIKYLAIGVGVFCTSIIGIAFVIALYQIITDPHKAQTKNPAPTAPVTTYQPSQDDIKQKEADEKDEAIHRCFTEWHGSCPTLVAFIKEHMNDPESFEHVETTFTYYGDHFFVIMKYRGKNAFGGKVLDYIKANVNSDKGQVLKVWK